MVAVQQAAAERVTFKRTVEVGAGVFLEIEIRGTAKGAELSICGSGPHGGGQNRGDVAGVAIKDLAPGFTPDMRDRVLAMWDRWHLNGMQAGCQHQRASWDLSKPIEFREYSIDWDVRRSIERNADAGNGAAALALRQINRSKIRPFAWVPLSSAELAALTVGRPAGQDSRVVDIPARFVSIPEQEGKAYEAKRQALIREYGPSRRPLPPAILVRTETKRAGWVRPTEHPDGLLCKPCEVCGYAYGSAWLFEELPADVIAFLETLPAIGEAGGSPYEIRAQRFLTLAGVRLTTEHTQAKASTWGGSARQHWRVTLSKPGGKRLAFDFWNSQKDTAEGIPLGAYSVLAAISGDLSYAGMSADEVAAELGGDMKPSQARAVAAFGAKLARFFTEAEQAQLGEIR